MINLSYDGGVSRRFLSLGRKKENEKGNCKKEKRHYILRYIHTYIICRYRPSPLMDNHPVETNFSLGSGGGGHHVRPTENCARQERREDIRRARYCGERGGEKEKNYNPGNRSDLRCTHIIHIYIILYLRKSIERGESETFPPKCMQMT